MSTAVKLQEIKIKAVNITEDTITAHLIDGRTISVPLAWSWRLSEATPEQRAHYEIIGDGQGRGYIGPILMRISAQRGCCTLLLPQDQKSLINNP